MEAIRGEGGRLRDASPGLSPPTTDMASLHCAQMHNPRHAPDRVAQLVTWVFINYISRSFTGTNVTWQRSQAGVMHSGNLMPLLCFRHQFYKSHIADLDTVLCRVLAAGMYRLVNTVASLLQITYLPKHETEYPTNHCLIKDITSPQRPHCLYFKATITFHNLQLKQILSKRWVT